MHLLNKSFFHDTIRVYASSIMQQACKHARSACLYLSFYDLELSGVTSELPQSRPHVLTKRVRQLY